MLNKCIELYKKYQEIINYLIIGVLTTIVSLVTYYLCVYTFLNPNNGIQLQIANIISWIISVTFAFFTNRSIVFKSKNKNVLKEAISFTGSRVATLLLDMGMMLLLVTIMGLNDKIIKLIVQVLVIVLNYIFSKIFVFNKNDIKL